MSRHPSDSAPASIAPRAAPRVTDLAQFLRQRRQQDLLRFITCGSVDDGKSTLIGRLLWEAQQLSDDQVAALRSDSRKYGTQAGELDFALLVDGLVAEREQAITIDVAYRYFGTARRRFIVADTPGHEQYTRNMVSAASTAEAAVLLVDAPHGLVTQTRRHTHLVSLMGIRHVALAVNKMDLVGFEAAPFERIRDEFLKLAATLGLDSVAAIPLSALRGDNVVERSANMPWYGGPTLLSYLETVKPLVAAADRLVFPVQWVNRPTAQFRGYSGCVAEGSVRVGDEIRVTASGRIATVAEIVTFDGPLEQAAQDEAVTLRLDRELDASRGDVLSLAGRPLQTSDHFEATLVWMGDEPGLIGRNYDLKLATQWSAASITTIKHRIDVNTLAHEACRKLELNDICVCNIATSRPLTFDAYSNSKALGSFILVDRFSRGTIAAGMIRHNLRRSENVHTQSLTVSRVERQRLNGHAGKVVWFTGLSASGKSTLANALEVELHSRGMRTYILDGDNVRQGLNKDLGFTDADRTENIRRIVEVAKLMMDAGLIVITAFISPFRHEREMARELIGSENFVEVHVSTSLDVCEQRDPKGLYKKARGGRLPNMTGIGSAYEPPLRPEISLDMGGTSVRQGVESLLKIL